MYTFVCNYNVSVCNSQWTYKYLYFNKYFHELELDIKVQLALTMLIRVSHKRTPDWLEGHHVGWNG